MASAVSLEYLTSIQGQPNGLATLDGTGKIPTAQLPATAIEVYLGVFANVSALTTAYPTAAQGNYAFVTGTGYYYWNAQLATPAWVSQSITATAYNALTTAGKTGVQYIIVP